MKVLNTSLPGTMIIEPDVFIDNRGFFMEVYHQKKYRKLGVETSFVQDNLSCSVQKTLRGLHYQLPHAQAKLVQVIKGSVFDVAVDIRVGSPSFGRWTGIVLSDQSKRQLFVPAGFAHGFCVLSEIAVFVYRCSDFYSPESERGILWSDPDIGIEWPLKNPLLSPKDRRYPRLKDVPREHLPIYKD